MAADSRIETWAKVLVGYSVGVEPGQTVAISGGVAAEPLLRAVYREVLAAGGLPVMMPVFSGLNADLLGRGSDEQIRFRTALERFQRLEADASIQVMADTNTKALSAVDPSRQSLFQSARRDLTEAFMRRAGEGALRWVLTLYPTDAYAQDAGMATGDFADFVYGAAKLDKADPIASWRAQGKEQQRLIDWLHGKREIHLVGPEADLRVGIAGRTWINAEGKRNFPDGEIFTSPIETEVNGHVRFSFPVVTAGREVRDIRLRFEGGKVVDASAAQDEAFLIGQLDTDEGSRRLGEFAFGTNFGITNFTKNILFDEKIGGTVHMAVGAGYPDTGSENRSAVHWDMICDLRAGGHVDIDGEAFLRDGRYVV